MFGKVLDGLFGKGGTGVANQAIEVAKDLGEDVYFRPATVTTGVAGTAYDPSTGALTGTLDPALQDIQDTALGGAGNMFGQVADFDPSARASQIFSEQAALLQPEFERQRTATRDSTFGSGRLGLQIGGVNPDFFGLGKAQSETMAALAPQAQQQAYTEMGQLAQLGTALQQAGMAPSEFQLRMFEPMIQSEMARSAAALGAGQLQLDPYAQAVSSADAKRAGNAGFFGSLVGGWLGGK